MNKFNCLRCNTEMNYIDKQKIQLGQTSWLLGDLPNLLSGALEVDIFSCPQCGRLEFFQSIDDSTEDSTGDNLPQAKCPKCGRQHDFDYPKCPNCNYNYFLK